MKLLLPAACLLFLCACAHAEEVESVTCDAPESTVYYAAYNELLCEGIAHLEGGQTADAVQSFEELLDLRIHEAPNHAPLSLMALAYWHDGDAEKAQAMLKKAKLALEVLVGVAQCVEDENFIYHLHKNGTRLIGPLAEEIGNLMCGAGYEYIYEQKSLEIVHGDAQLIQRYFDVRDEITAAPMVEQEELNGSNQPTAPQRDCSLVEMSDNLTPDQLDANKEKIKLPQMSAQGHTATAYRLNKQIKFIHVGIYGETGQTELIYQFGNSDWRTVAAKVTETNYMMSLWHKPFQLASTAVHQFTLCDGKNADFPNMYEIERPANMAASVLQTLKEVIPEQSR